MALARIQAVRGHTKKQRLAALENVKLAQRAATKKQVWRIASRHATTDAARRALSVSRTRKRAVCEICGVLSFPHKDHDHKTGRQRGLLCFQCNVGLGHFKDDYKQLLKAVEYLKKYEIRRFPRLKIVA